MNFRFHIGKATEAACLFLDRGGGRMNIMKLVGMALGLAPAQIQRLRQEAVELNRLDDIFASA